MQKPKINWEINLGEILSIISMLTIAGSVMFGAWHNLDNRIGEHDKRITLNERNIEVVNRQLIRIEDRNSKRFEEILLEIRAIRKQVSNKADR